MRSIPHLMMWLSPSLLLLLLQFTDAKATTTSSITAKRTNSVLSKEYIKKFLEEKDLPPIEVDMQFDFEILPTRTKSWWRPFVPTQWTANKKQKSPVRTHSPPRNRTIISTKKRNGSRELNIQDICKDIQNHIGKAKNHILAHKYATVVWASLLMVWVPLLVILAINEVMGKDAFVEVLVRMLPDDFPPRFIELVIEDMLWVGIFGVTLVATAGAFSLEMMTLVNDICKTLVQR